MPLPVWLGIEPRWGVAGLTASAGVAGWVEFTLLRRTLNRRIGKTGLTASLTLRLWTSALMAAAAAWSIKLALGTARPTIDGAAILAVYGATYFAVTYALQVEESAGVLNRLARFAHR